MSDAMSMNEAVAAIESVMDDRGLMPSDDDYTAPDESQEEVEEVEGEEAEDESQEETSGEESEDAQEEGETDEADAESSEANDPLFDITIDGDEYEVNLEELKGGYLRNEDYLKKLREVDEAYDNKMAEAEAKQSEVLALYEEVLQNAATELGQFRNINWAQLQATDPEKYKELRLAALEAQDRAQAQVQKRQQLQAALQQAELIKHQAYLGKQMELARKIVPDFGTPEFASGMLKWGKDVGFTEDELNSIADARHLLVLDKARRYDELMSKRKVGAEKMSKDLPPVVKPGAPKAAGQEKVGKVKAARTQFNKTGDVRDAAAVFLARGIFD